MLAVVCGVFFMWAVVCAFGEGGKWFVVVMCVIDGVRLQSVWSVVCSVCEIGRWWLVVVCVSGLV